MTVGLKMWRFTKPNEFVCNMQSFAAAAVLSDQTRRETVIITIIFSASYILHYLLLFIHSWSWSILTIQSLLFRVSSRVSCLSLTPYIAVSQCSNEMVTKDKTAADSVKAQDRDQHRAPAPKPLVSSATQTNKLFYIQGESGNFQVTVWKDK